MVQKSLKIPSLILVLVVVVGLAVLLQEPVLLAPSLAVARHRCNSVRLLTPLPADCYFALNSEFYYEFAHFKQVGPEIPSASFGPFPGACRF
jgi:hypothetical protein